MIHLTGSKVLSSAMAKKLVDKLAESGIVATKLHSHYLHIGHLEGELDSESIGRLAGLLDYGESSDPQPELTTFYVVPRFGTISPWSSKATEIVRNCGLTQVLRVERAKVFQFSFSGAVDLNVVKGLIHDRMMEEVTTSEPEWHKVFERQEPKPLEFVPLMEGGQAAIEEANSSLGLALADDEMEYLVNHYTKMGRNPTDVELMMFAQANSEHCRHKIFNADWHIDGEAQDKSLFKMIKNTFATTPENVLSAYKDNAAVMKGAVGRRFFPDAKTRAYGETAEEIHTLMKVETHNHPTAISPFPGAATGSGGEIRDEGATGRGGKPKAGLTGFSVSNLRIPGLTMPWEGKENRPDRIASPFQIMMEGPIGGASFNNEFGRPNICGYFRTFEQTVGPLVRGYHKPIMLAGGLGNIRPNHVEKKDFSPGALILVLGGPAMLIGLGGGAASSMAGGDSDEELDFASVQRGNPEMERRCQEVLDRCWAMGDNNPIAFIHDVGAGGLSNALPEIVSDGGRGGSFDLRSVPSDDPGMSPLELWCNESQERYVLAIEPEDLNTFRCIAERERCPFAVLGEATEEKRLKVSDQLHGNTPIDLSLDMLLGKPPKMTRREKVLAKELPPLDLSGVTIKEALYRVLSLPTVADKSFLITIGDRSVTGLIAQDQMVGPWQVPVADAGITSSDYVGYTGEAMAMGERPPVALINSGAAARLAVCEALSNLAGADIGKLEGVKLSANWQAAPNHEGEGSDLFAAVKAIGEELCPTLGLTIPVGKDSMSMKTTWTDNLGSHDVVSPVSLVISAFGPVKDVRKTVTPMLQRSQSGTTLLVVDLGAGNNRLGGSCLAQVYNQVGDKSPDLVDAGVFKAFWYAMQELVTQRKLLAYHDRSDGGLITTLIEMAFAGKAGLEVNLSSLGTDATGILFSEELGGVLQVQDHLVQDIKAVFVKAGVPSELIHEVGTISNSTQVRITLGADDLVDESLSDLRNTWSRTTYEMQKARDNPITATQEHESRLDMNSPGLSPSLTFDVSEVGLEYHDKPKVAVLREQGVNGQTEMAAAFFQAGLEAIDVHMSDLIEGRQNLGDFSGLVACGGFSYGDVLGAGQGWAKTILGNHGLREQFREFFERKNTFTLGVCNGCQMLSHLRDIIPGASHWPKFTKNLSDQFEARLSMVKIEQSPSILLKGMEGSRIPVVVSHGEGRAEFLDQSKRTEAEESALIPLRYVDPYGQITEQFPYNPNGSPGGITSLTTQDGRATIMMPHPERVFRASQFSWCPEEWGNQSPWAKLFSNAREWLAKD